MLELGPTRLRSKLRVGALVALVAVLVTTAMVLVQTARAQVLTPEQVQTALTRSFADRAPAFTVAQPARLPKAVAPADCVPLLLRPWLVDAWPEAAIAASQTGTAEATRLPPFGVVSFTFDEPREAKQVFDASRQLLDARTCSGAVIETQAFRTAPFTLDVVQQPPVEPINRNCDLLAFQTTASDHPGFPHRTRTQLLRYGNTLSWQIQRSPYDEYLIDGSPVSVGDAELPSLASLCQQLRAMGTSG